MNPIKQTRSQDAKNAGKPKPIYNEKQLFQLTFKSKFPICFRVVVRTRLHLISDLESVPKNLLKKCSVRVKKLPLSQIDRYLFRRQTGKTPMRKMKMMVTRVTMLDSQKLRHRPASGKHDPLISWVKNDVPEEPFAIDEDEIFQSVISGRKAVLSKVSECNRCRQIKKEPIEYDGEFKKPPPPAPSLGKFSFHP